MEVEIMAKDDMSIKKPIDCVVITIGDKEYRLSEKNGDLMIVADSEDLGKLKLKFY